jgi:hypothetical protein
LIVPAVLMLFLILGQSTYWTGSFNSLAHALDHEKTGLAATLEEHHGNDLHGNGVPGSDPVSEPEHNLLHQFEHTHLVPLSVSPPRVLAGMAVMVAFPLLHMEQRRNERMFRPPRLS